LQSLASSQWQTIFQTGVYFGLGTADYPLSSGTRNALCVRWDSAFSQRSLRSVPECSLNARPAQKDAVSVFIPMKPYSSSYANSSRQCKDEPNFVNEWWLSIPWPILAEGSDDARYRGLRKNLFDLRRCAVVHNLHVLARS